MKEIDRHIDIMGIVNLTDDSYFAGSRCAGCDEALERMAVLIAEGASIIDLGACSTRPGSEPVGPMAEWERLCPVIEAAVERFQGMRLSIDTYHAEVVEKAYRLISDKVGEDVAGRILVVNDISAGEDDPGMLPLVGRLGLSYVAMHKRGKPSVMQDMCQYDDVVEEVLRYFEDFAVKAEAYGIEDWIIDPGFGFSKTVEQNYALLNGLDKFAETGRKVLVGVSRKSMIYRKLGITPEESLPATQVLHLKALQNGADILRVHDVAEAVRTVALYRVLR